ncbi:MAG: HlyC/CorC family transporter [Pseudomonadota bacterium]|nr:HlyC/CorC family transporter [Pseudomonadota bacterium]
MDNTSSERDALASAPETSQETRPRPSLLQSMRDWLHHKLAAREASLKEAIEEVIEEHAEQTDEGLAPEEKVMLHNVLSFSDIKVSDIMVQRTDIAAVPVDISLPDFKAHLLAQRHTRIPVYEESLDHVLGFAHVKDLLPMLAGDTPFDIRSALRSLLFVPPSMPIIDLLVKMRQAGSHMAIVVDEYGGTDGLVTMEDLFEEIVGDIQDEHDWDEEPEDRIVKVGDHVFEVNARIPVETLEKELGLPLVAPEKSGEIETLGGLISFQLGRVPSRGETVPHPSGARFEILDADPRRIRRVRILTA